MPPSSSHGCEARSAADSSNEHQLAARAAALCLTQAAKLVEEVAAAAVAAEAKP